MKHKLPKGKINQSLNSLGISKANVENDGVLFSADSQTIEQRHFSEKINKEQSVFQKGN